MASFSVEVDGTTSSKIDNDSEPIIDLRRSKRATRNQHTVYRSPEFLRLTEPIESEDDETGQQPAKRVKLSGGEQGSNSNKNAASTSSNGSHAGGPDHPNDILHHMVIKLEEVIISDDEMEYPSNLEEESGSDQLTIGEDRIQDENEEPVSNDAFSVPLIMGTYSLADSQQANLEPSPPILEVIGQDDFNEARDTLPSISELDEPELNANGGGVDKGEAQLEKIRLQNEAIDRFLQLILLMTERSSQSG